MKSVYLLMLVSLCQGWPSVERPAKLSPPHSLDITTLDNAIQISWSGVDSGDVDEPVLAYKVKIWKVRKLMTQTHAKVNGEWTKTEKEELEPIHVVSGPSGEPDVIIKPADQTTAKYCDVEPNATYEIRVQALTKNGESPDSNPVRVQII
ncbi:hypothetical protein PYW08_001871 [Mythimna loreyi]|uniref:Uncharacterized protein n=1 Tax=Mythimna loreyi TaxID=667449 RepID=A0ACC2R5T2_9NEOP|nr:hypothetical protein PYW08_001871 [Mythimna loreyi]